MCLLFSVIFTYKIAAAMNWSQKFPSTPDPNQLLANPNQSLNFKLI
ncbi:hypothetical protein PROVALCAL_01405 [Providencia alcalifaciens DSM 30120]|uniref:Uncharacterized protein n=1 Tax=Providencia alcalifaciens DSM 30120 TaxID=520999 RepID=B6XDI3_9GAMM|nr:hypothetical protein PROVALCAL_01405 [Providencia alcalifaciens DSM 30120]